MTFKNTYFGLPEFSKPELDRVKILPIISGKLVILDTDFEKFKPLIKNIRPSTE
jgi:hypothetical protein